MKKALLFLVLLGAASAWADPSDDQVTSVLEHDMHARGQATMDRVKEDALQRVCNETHDKPPAELARTLEADQMKTVVYPQGSLLGDWKRGEKMAQDGRGSTWSDKPGVAAGASCYNCHQISPKEISYGNLGPSLLGFGKKRGYDEKMQRYVYAKIYNAKAFNACSTMPRMGYAGTLDAQQIKDLTALLLDPSSPVNQ